MQAQYSKKQECTQELREGLVTHHYIDVIVVTDKPYDKFAGYRVSVPVHTYMSMEMALLFLA